LVDRLGSINVLRQLSIGSIASKEDLRNPDVVTKYRAAGDIANAAMKTVIGQVAPGVKLVTLCAAGDSFIEAETGKVFNVTKASKDGKKVKVEKGVAFPTCISVNHIVGHYSPLSGDTAVLKVGDIVKM
jgi:methionine aminopeptidase